MVWQSIDEVEMEVTDELWVVFEYHQHYVHRGCVEALHGIGCLDSREKVVLDEGEAAHEEVLDFVQLVQLDVVLILLLLVWVILTLSFLRTWIRVFKSLLHHQLVVGWQIWYHFDEMWEEELVRDQLQPSEGETWIVVRVEILEQVS